jgi:uncharacterized protein YyaL (SSP411 family)
MRPYKAAMVLSLLSALAAAALARAQESPGGSPQTRPATAPAGERQGISWLEFGPEAFAVAGETERPILLYISAGWEYHDGVMSSVTYSDSRVERLLRDRYVPVKVDTDERPDLFFRYGMGGWPTTAVLLSNGHPFYFPEKEGKTVKRAGGTFFTPEKFDAYFTQLADYYAENREMVHTLSERTDDEILKRRNAEREAISPKSLEVVIGVLLDRHSRRPESAEPGQYHPEFDMAELAFYYWHLKADRQVLDMGLDHLVDLARGGIHDRVGGGFFRYALDSLYRVPAFEKLPSVNARALETYLQAYQVTRHMAYLRVALGVAEYVRSRGWSSTSRSFTGAMAAATPAGKQGDYYTWTEDELRGILSEEEFQVAAPALDIRPIGEMTEIAPRRNVIYLREGPILLASRMGMTRVRAEEILSSVTAKMLAARSRREAPPVDSRTFSDGTGMLASALLHAAVVLNEEAYADLALESLETLMVRCRTAGRLMAHVCKPDLPLPGPMAFLSDQARVIGALLDAYEFTGREKYLTRARGLADLVPSAFRDVTTGGLSDAPPDPEAPGLVAWPLRDMKENMAMAVALLRVGHLSGESRYQKNGRRTVESWADEFGKVARHASAYALASQKFLQPPLEVIVAGGAGEGEAAARARRGALRLYHPWRVLRHFDAGAGAEEIRRRGLKPMDGLQVAFCIGEECAGPYPAEAPLDRELDSFLSRGGDD